jgi:hypothetical protein
MKESSMSGGKSSKQKGYRVENSLVKKLIEAGLEAQRVPLSGGAGGAFDGDIVIKYPALQGEVKARANGQGFKMLMNWLGNNDFLILKQDNREPLVVVNFELFADLLADVKLHHDHHAEAASHGHSDEESE